MNKLNLTLLVLSTLALAAACDDESAPSPIDAPVVRVDSGGGGSGGSDAAGGSGGRTPDSGARDVAVDTSAAEAGAAPSQAFVDIYNTILNTSCSPCHTTNAMRPPNNNPFDLSSVTAAFNTITAVSTMCVGATERRRVVPGNPDMSFLMLKLLGTQPVGAGCGVRMPRTPMRTDPPPCVDPTDGGAGVDSGTIADAGGTGDGGTDAAPQPAPRACLPPADVARIRAWIMSGAR